MKQKEDTYLVQISNSGAVEFIDILSLVLGYLSAIPSEYKTREEIKLKAITDIEKALKWLDREDDGTLTKEETVRAKKLADEALRLWKK
jgi:hypothetical protein